MHSPPAIAASLLARLRADEEAMVSLLTELALLETPSLDASSQRPLFERLTRELGGLGMRVQQLRGRTSGGCLYASPPRLAGRPAQLLVGHCDTVWPTGTLRAMPVERRDGCLYGPGVFDMKGGLVQVIFALRALAELGLQPAVRPVLLVNSDEEIGSFDARRHLRRLARHACRVFVMEPALGARGDLKTRRKGVGQFTLRVHGRASHAGLDPELGASAIRELAHVVERVYSLAQPARGVTINVGVMRGGLRANVVAPEASAEVDVRVFEPSDAPVVEAAMRGLTAHTPGTRLEVEGSIDRPPLMPTAANLTLWRMAEEAAALLGLTLGHGTAGGASDGNLTSLHAATLDGLGAVGGGAHSLDEHVEIARLPERAALLAMLLLAPPEEKTLEAGSLSGAMVPGVARPLS